MRRVKAMPTGVSTNPSTSHGRHNKASQRTLSYLRKNANIDITYVDLTAELEMTSSSLSNALGHLKRKGFPIYMPMRGVVRYVTEPVKSKSALRVTEPEKIPESQVFQSVIVTKPGTH